MLKPFEEALLSLLNIFFSFTHSYGLSIILLTIAIRILLLPLTYKQTKAQLDLQKIQPKIKEIQKKYAKDKQKLQEELMKVYSENKVNPFGGCLPLLIQLPIFWALFRMLITNKDLARQGFLIIPSLGKAAARSGVAIFSGEGLPYLVMLALLALTTYWPSKMLSTDKQQETTMLFMSIFMLFIAWQLPAGVLLYWITTNILTVLQQYIQVELERRKS